MSEKRQMWLDFCEPIGGEVAVVARLADVICHQRTRLDGGATCDECKRRARLVFDAAAEAEWWPLGYGVLHAKPRRHAGGDSYHGTNLRVSFDRKPGTIVLECEIAAPPSSKGRTVYVVFEADDLTDALKALRDEAIRARAKPLEA